MLNWFSNFWKHVFNMEVHVIFGIYCIILRFSSYLFHVHAVLNYIRQHLSGLFMCFDKINTNVIWKRKVIKQIIFEESSNQGCFSNFTNEIQVWTRQDVWLDKVPVFHISIFMIKSSISWFHQHNNSLWAALTFFKVLPIHTFENC